MKIAHRRHKGDGGFAAQACAQVGGGGNDLHIIRTSKKHSAFKQSEAGSKVPIPASDQYEKRTFNLTGLLGCSRMSC
jgi:hypothetical protein